jgi:hypothetical protein
MEASADPASDRLGSIPEVTLTSLGGEDAVLVDATAIAGSPALPRLVPAVELDWARLNRRHELIEVLRQGLLQPISPR